MSNTSKYFWTSVHDVEGTLTFVTLTPAADGKVQARKDREIAAAQANDGSRLALVQVVEEGQVKKVCAFVPDDIPKVEKPKKAKVEQVSGTNVEDLLAEPPEIDMGMGITSCEDTTGPNYEPDPDLDGPEIASVLPPVTDGNGSQPEAFAKGATLYINLPDGTQYKRMYASPKGVAGVLVRVNDYIEKSRPLDEFTNGMTANVQMPV